MIIVFMGNAAKYTLLSFVFIAILTGAIVYFFLSYKTNSFSNLLKSKSHLTQSINFNPIPTTYFILPDNERTMLGYSISSPDKRFTFFLGKLTQLWISDKNVYADVQLSPSSKTQAILLYKNVDHLIFDLQVQQTLDFFPISKDFSAQYLQDGLQILHQLIPYKGQLVIFTMQTSTITNPSVGKERIFSILNSYVLCNATFSLALEQRKEENVSCTPYISKISVYGK